MAEPEYNATVAQRIEIAPGLIVLRVVPDVPEFSFVAGQYTVLGLRRSHPRIDGASDHDAASDPDRMIRRAYSIASSSRANEYVEFYITHVPSGELTPRLFNLGLKDRLFLGPRAKGLFTLDQVPVDRSVLLVGTGTGLAPYMSMLRSEVVYGGPRLYVVLHGARHSWDLGYRNELALLARVCPNVKYIPVVSRPAEDACWKGPTGHLQDVLRSGLVEERAGVTIDPETLHVFLCGNPGMIEETKQLLIPMGFVADKPRQPGNLHTEEYW